MASPAVKLARARRKSLVGSVRIYQVSGGSGELNNDGHRTDVNGTTQRGGSATNACRAISVDVLENLTDKSGREKGSGRLAASSVKLVTAAASSHNVSPLTTLLQGTSRGRVDMEPERLPRKLAC